MPLAMNAVVSGLLHSLFANLAEDSSNSPAILQVLSQLVETLGDGVALLSAQVIAQSSDEAILSLFQVLGDFESFSISLLVSPEYRDRLSLCLAKHYHQARPNTPSVSANKSIGLTVQLFSVDTIAYNIASTNHLIFIINSLFSHCKEAVVNGRFNVKHEAIKEKLTTFSKQSTNITRLDLTPPLGNKVSEITVFQTSEYPNKQYPFIYHYIVLYLISYIMFVNPALIIDPVLRVLVWQSQVKGSMWVRNGSAVLLQSASYTHTDMCRQDFYLLQYCVQAMTPSAFYSQLLDRSELSSWFILDGVIQPPSDESSTKRMKHLPESDRSSIIVAEDLLALVVSIVADRTKLANLPLDQVVRREIIHTLAICPVTHSALVGRHPELLENYENLDSILSQVAVYMPATGRERATYALRPTCWNEWDAYYPHYSQAELAKAEERYMEHAKHTGIALQRPLRALTPALPVFLSIEAILHCDLLHALLYSVFHNAASMSPRCSETLLIHSIHLVSMILASIDSNQAPKIDASSPRKQQQPSTLKYEHMDFGFHPTDFISNMFHEVKSPNGHFFSTAASHSLYSIINVLCSSSSYQSHHPVLEKILDHPLIRGLRSPRAVSTSSSPENTLGSSALQKEMAKRRQEEIMKKFSQQQKAFLKNSKDNSDQPQVEQSEEFETTLGDCAICKEEMSQLKRIGPVVTNGGTSEILRDVYRTRSSFVAFCSHAIHMSCFPMLFKNSLARGGSQEFHCPCCRRLSNAILPYSDSPLSPFTVPSADGQESTSDHSSLVSWILESKDKEYPVQSTTTTTSMDPMIEGNAPLSDQPDKRIYSLWSMAEYDQLTFSLGLDARSLLSNDIAGICADLWIVNMPVDNIQIPLRSYDPFTFYPLPNDFHKFFLDASKRSCSTCGGGIAVLMLMSEALVFILNRTTYKVWGTLYLDQHGDEDIGLKRGKPLYLNKERVQRLKSDLLDLQLQNTTTSHPQFGGR
eukprot:gene12396-14546_t